MLKQRVLGYVSIVFAFVVLFAIVGCEVTVEPLPIPVTSLSFNPTSATLDVGETHVISFTISPPNADDKHITWTSNNPSIASVASNGTITANSSGIATITGETRSGGHTANFTVTVRNVQVTGVTVNPINQTLTVGQTFTIVPTVIPNNATNKEVTWHNSNEAVASVTTGGLVTALSAGNTRITVRTVEGQFEAYCDVTVTSTDTGVIPPPDWVDLYGYRFVELYWEAVNSRWEYWILYNSATAMNNTSLSLRVNNQAVVEQGVELNASNTEWFSYGYIPVTLPGGINVDVQLTTPEGVSNITMSVPHQPLVSSTTPSVFNPTQNFTINWNITAGGADLQWIDFWAGAQSVHPDDFDLYLVYLRNDIRNHTMPASTFAPNQNRYEFWVVNTSNRVDRNTLFLITREDYRGNLGRSTRMGNQNRRERFIRMREALINS
ncbi:MAG: Ig-like domain-containing protein [Candidatus Cloacimonetes bacterium]|nr:Ig-like domain-containing protein [Candidatus Cloacimonadota bacterium]